MSDSQNIWSRIRGFFHALIQDRINAAPRLERELHGKTR